MSTPTLQTVLQRSEAVSTYIGFLEMLAHKPVCCIMSDVVLY